MIVQGYRKLKFRFVTVWLGYELKLKTVIKFFLSNDMLQGLWTVLIQIRIEQKIQE